MGLCCSMNPEDQKSLCSQQNCEYFKQFHTGHCFYKCSNQQCLKYKKFHNGFCKFQQKQNENQNNKNDINDYYNQMPNLQGQNLDQKTQKQLPVCNNKQCEKFNQNHGELNCQVICYNGACVYFKKYHEIGRCLYLQNGYYYKIIARISQSDNSSKSRSSLLIPQYQTAKLKKSQRNDGIENHQNIKQQRRLKNNRNNQQDQMNTSIERDNSCIVSMPELEINFPKIMSYNQQSYKNPGSYNNYLSGEQSQF